jgi:hypothetical protein
VVAATSLLSASTALATTQTASAGNVSASFSFSGSFPNYTGETLSISQSGSVLYHEPVSSKYCGTQCAPGVVTGHGSSVHVVDLEGSTQPPDVVLDLFSGGAHCCFIDQVFSLEPGTTTYVVSQHNFGDPGERLEPIGPGGRDVFVTADDSFAYEFTDYAASGLPLQILGFSQGRFANITRAYPKLIAKDAALWLRVYRGTARQHYQDSVGAIAAWAADADELGHSRHVAVYLAQQARLGHLNSALNSLSPKAAPDGAKFVAKLKRFLRRHGYQH